MADGLTGVTQLPAGVALAAAWDPSLAQQYGQVIGAEEFGKGASANLGPTVNIDRDPRWGRSFEALSEDPFLNSALDVAEIGGVQSQGVMAQVKHFAAYNQETFRNTAADNVIVDNRAEHEIYLPSFQAAIQQANAASVMCAYSMVNGNFSCNNSNLETSVLRDEWGFPGFMTSDYGALHSTQAGGAGHRHGAAGEHLLRDGALLRHPEGDHPAQRAEHHGAADPDRDVRLQPVQPAADGIHLGHGHHASQPGGGHDRRRGGHHAAEELRPRLAAPGIERRYRRRHRASRVRLARLRRRRQRLCDPLGDHHPARRYPGCGRVRHERRLLQGLPTDTSLPSIPSGNLSPAYSATPSGGSYTGTLTAPETGTYVLALTNPCGCYTSTTLSLNGQQILDDPSTPPVHTYSVAMSLTAGQRYTLSVSGQSSQLLWGTPSALAPGINAAVSAATSASTAVVVVSDDTESEAADRPSLNLPSAQDELIEAVAAVNPNTVVVINAGAPIAMPWLSQVAGCLMTGIRVRAAGHRWRACCSARPTRAGTCR